MRQATLTRPDGDDFLRLRPMGLGDDPEAPPPGADVLLLPEENALYAVGFAASKRCVQRAQRLRYEVFNLELGEGLLDSEATGLDQDTFDAQMAHLVLLERATHRVVGTYRLQTARRAASGAGFYSADEYDLEPLADHLGEAVECGRACIHSEHRSFVAMLLLWKGILAFTGLKKSRWLFGCSSLTTLDPDEGWRALKTLRAFGRVHPELSLRAREGYSCGDPSREFEASLGPATPLPKLFSAYMRLGGHAISEPALDRAFGTVDFLILVDAASVRFGSITRENVMRKLALPSQEAST